MVDEEKAASVFWSIQSMNYKSMHADMQQGLNMDGMQGAAEINEGAAEINLHNERNCNSAAISLFAKAATYGSDESNNAEQYGQSHQQYSMQMAGAGAPATTISIGPSTPVAASPGSDLTSFNPSLAMDQDIINGLHDAANARISNAINNCNNSNHYNNYSSCVESRVNSYNNNTTGNSRKRSRSAPWTVPEMLTLIEAKRNERQRWSSYKTRGLKLPGAEKWKLVSRYLEGRDMGRSGSQCQDKWENMMKDYKAVRDWQLQFCSSEEGGVGGGACGGGGRSYFKHMTNKERKEARLPPQMDESIFCSLHAIQNEKEEQRRKASSSTVPIPKPKPAFADHNHPLTLSPAQELSHTNHHKSISQLLTTSNAENNSESVALTRNTTHTNDFISRLINTNKEEINCISTHPVESILSNHEIEKAANRSLAQQLQQEGSQVEHRSIKETATLVQVLVALADAVKTVAQKL